MKKAERSKLINKKRNGSRSAIARPAKSAAASFVATPKKVRKLKAKGSKGVKRKMVTALQTGAIADAVPVPPVSVDAKPVWRYKPARKISGADLGLSNRFDREAKRLLESINSTHHGESVWEVVSRARAFAKDKIERERIEALHKPRRSASVASV